MGEKILESAPEVSGQPGESATGFISDQFFSQYFNQMPANAGPLFYPVYLRTYCRWLDDLNRRETWSETVRRVVNYSVGLYQGSASPEALRIEAEYMFDQIFNLRVLPAGRTLWVGGTEAIRKLPESAYNCSFCVIDNIDAFGDIFHLLLCGSGAGFRVLKNDVAQLPHFTSLPLNCQTYQPIEANDRLEHTESQIFFNPQNRKMTYAITVGDSKEAWVKSLRLFLNISANPGQAEEIQINFDNIRPQGERIKTFGGRAAGPGGLCEMFQQLAHIIQRSGGVFSPTDATDLNNIIALNVVVGGNRRSSQIALGSPSDGSFIDMKKGLWTDPDKKGVRWRVMSNNSVTFESKPSHEVLEQIFQGILDNGEPGFFNLEAARARRPNANGTNPCFAPGTSVLTTEGHFPIEDLVGKIVTIWDGAEWRTVDNFRVTAVDQPLLELILSSGTKLQATPYHSFILESGERKQLKDLQKGDRLMMHEEQIHGTHREISAYAKGMLVADGTSNHIKPILKIYPPKYVCIPRVLESLEESPIESRNTNTVTMVTVSDESFGRRGITGLSARKNELLPWATEYKQKLPEGVLNWDLESKLNFIAGVMDGDGTASDTKNGFLYQICSVYKSWLEDFQILLRSIGVKSKLSLGKVAAFKDFGEDRGGVYACREYWRLTISQIASIHLAKQVKFERLTSFADKTVSYMLRSREAIVESVRPCGLADKVYCCTVEGSHSFALSNGLIVGQCGEINLDNRGVCNLSELVMTSFIEGGGFRLGEMLQAIRLATRIGLRQTNVTISLPKWDFIQKRDRLTGVSLTGIMDAFDKLGWEFDSPEAIDVLQKLRQAANDEADIYSVEMGVPRPVLVTCIKPSGSLSQLPTVSSGLHRGYAPYYIRRIRVSSGDPVCKALKFIGVSWEPCKSKSDRTVFSFPIKTAAKIAATDECALRQLERYYVMQRNYTDHNSSCTIYLSPKEKDAMIAKIEDNWDDTLGIALLPKFVGDAFPQCPYEEITEAEYLDLAGSTPDFASLPDVVNRFETGELGDLDLDYDSSCASGVCPLR